MITPSSLALHRPVSRLEDVGPAGVVLTLDTGNNPIAGTDDVTTLAGIDPAVQVHDVSAVLAVPFSVVCWITVAANDPSLRNELLTVSGLEQSGIIQGVIAVHEPP